MIKRNIGNADMFVRLIIGILLIVVAFSMTQSLVQIVIVTFGVIVLLTGIFNFCPFYQFFSFSTKENKIDKITKNEIKKAIREYKSEQKETSKPKSQINVTPITKKASKKTTKKVPSKTIKKVSKKTTKKTTKKTAKKTLNK